MVPVWVTIPDDVPARETFQLIFDWSSTGDATVSDQASITIEARPDHRWDISIEEGYEIDVVPGQEVNLTINITNIGNSDDLLTITPLFDVSHSGNDTSIWSASEINSTRLDVNQMETLSLNFDVPTNTWATTMANLSLKTSSADFEIDYDISVRFNVLPVSKWSVDLSNTSLEVEPNGSEIQLTIEQKGNFPDAPYFAKAGQGWEVVLPSNGDIISPGEVGQINITVIPPEDAVAGEVG